MRGNASTLVVLALALGCGRTDVTRDAGTDAPLSDSGTPDSGISDAGPILPNDGGMCPWASDAGIVTGDTPRGHVAYRYVWVGTEPKGSHSCPHFSVNASDYPPGTQNVPVLQLDFADSSGGTFSVPGDIAGHGNFLPPNQAPSDAQLFAHVTAADGLTLGNSVANTTWRTSLTFFTVDAGEWNLTGQVDTLECPYSTWFCL